MTMQWFYRGFDDDGIDGIMEAKGESGTVYEIRPFGKTFLLVKKTSAGTHRILEIAKEKKGEEVSYLQATAEAHENTTIK